jgi:hypothetical protein
MQHKWFQTFKSWTVQRRSSQHKSKILNFMNYNPALRLKQEALTILINHEMTSKELEHL